MGNFSTFCLYSMDYQGDKEMTKRDEEVIKSQIKDFLDNYNLTDELEDYCKERNFIELNALLFED